jgi:hypothetical protein
MLVNLLPVAMILGVLGGASGLVVGFMNHGLKILSGPWDVFTKAGQVLAIVCPLLSILGGLLTQKRTTAGTMLLPELGGMMMFLSGVAMIGVLGISLLAALAGGLCVIGGVLALIASDDLKQRAG